MKGLISLNSKQGELSEALAERRARERHWEEQQAVWSEQESELRALLADVTRHQQEANEEAAASTASPSMFRRHA